MIHYMITVTLLNIKSERPLHEPLDPIHPCKLLGVLQASNASYSPTLQMLRNTDSDVADAADVARLQHLGCSRINNPTNVDIGNPITNILSNTLAYWFTNTHISYSIQFRIQNIITSDQMSSFKKHLVHKSLCCTKYDFVGPACVQTNKQKRPCEEWPTTDHKFKEKQNSARNGRQQTPYLGEKKPSNNPIK